MTNDCMAIAEQIALDLITGSKFCPRTGGPEFQQAEYLALYSTKGDWLGSWSYQKLVQRITQHLTGQFQPGMTPEEADTYYDAAPEVPLSPDKIRSTVAYVRNEEETDHGTQ